MLSNDTPDENEGELMAYADASCTTNAIDMKTISQQSTTGHWIHKPVRHPACRAAAKLLRWTINRFMSEKKGTPLRFWMSWIS